MKKYLVIMLTIFFVGALEVSAQSNVYIATGSNAVAYHKNKDCGYLRNAKEVKSTTLTNAKNIGRHACKACYKDKAATQASPKKSVTKKSATKKSATDKKTADKKVGETKKSTKTVAKKTTKTTTNAKKANTPARDEKGRFVKKADSDTKKAAAAKTKTTTKKAAKKTTTTKKTTTKKAA